MGTHGRRPDDAQYQALRKAAAWVLLGLVVFLVNADVFGRLLLDSTFEIRDTMLGAVLGALMLVLGIRAIRNGGPKDPPSPPQEGGPRAAEEPAHRT